MTKETIRSFVKKLIQICTPESLISSAIPMEYFLSYNEEQEHFDLNRFIKNRITNPFPTYNIDSKENIVIEEKKDINVTKDILFTRTTGKKEKKILF